MPKKKKFNSEPMKLNHEIATVLEKHFPSWFYLFTIISTIRFEMSHMSLTGVRLVPVYFDCVIFHRLESKFCLFFKM